jgi:hypothetical protein
VAGCRECCGWLADGDSDRLIGGIVVGLSAAYYGGWYDEIVMRVMDAIMAFPFIILALLILAVTGPSAGNVILVIGLGFIPLTVAWCAPPRCRYATSTSSRRRVCAERAASTSC